MADSGSNLDSRPESPKLQKTDKNLKPKEKRAGNIDTKGLTVTRSRNLATWYTKTITKAGIISYYDVQGCYILEPPLIFAWEEIRKFFDAKIKTIGKLQFVDLNRGSLPRSDYCL
ncbi:hypothetical protein V2W45_1364157 [Cenococcum geophilum]